VTRERACPPPSGEVPTDAAAASSIFQAVKTPMGTAPITARALPARWVWCAPTGKVAGTVHVSGRASECQDGALKPAPSRRRRVVTWPRSSQIAD
jgi:hypothetical protein